MHCTPALQYLSPRPLLLSVIGDISTQIQLSQRPEKKNLTYELGEEDDEERRQQIVDALYVATRWVAYGPNVQDPLQDLSGKGNVSKPMS